MLPGSISGIKRYEFKNPRFSKAMEFINRNDLKSLTEGWYGLGDGVKASVQHYTTNDSHLLSFESHEKFYDLQFIVSGKESMGVTSREGMEVKGVYDKDNDVTLYLDPIISGNFIMHPGDYIVLAPEDVHKPRCSVDKDCAVIKIVVKIPV